MADGQRASKRGAPVQLDYKNGSREQSGRAATKAGAPVRLEYKNGSPNQSGRAAGQPHPGGQRYTPPAQRHDTGPVWDDSGLSGAQRSATSAVMSVLSAYGLGSLANDVIKYVKRGYDAQTIYLELQNTTAWQKRFSGNAARLKKGLPALSPADYLSTESAYRQVLSQYGLPKGFYDDQSDLAKFIGNDVSPSELQSRAQMYTQFAVNSDSATHKALQQYGLGTGDLVAYLMNPGRALPLIQKRAQQVQVAAAAIRQGVGVGKGLVNRLVDNGVTADQAQAGFGQVAQYGGDLAKLGDVYGTNYNTDTAVKDFILGQGGAAKKREKLASQERATFSGSSRGSVGSGSSNQSF